VTARDLADQATSVSAPAGRIDSVFYRQVLSRFCSGVTIVTGVSGEPGAAAPAGFTCQSFASLSLDPPLVVFTAGRDSRSWPQIRRSGAFCVNILAAGQEVLGRAFAVSGADKFDGVDWGLSPATGSPVLPGALAWLDCTVEAEHPGGDHRIVVGRVWALDIALPSARPLLFYAAGFHELGAGGSVRATPRPPGLAPLNKGADP
jgi:3-hydroxy-9,10-secoandrosta-1,3,5(10)-triene-9,17-dione monooxygenase reductase component